MKHLTILFIILFFFSSLFVFVEPVEAACYYPPNTTVDCGGPNYCDGCNLVNDVTRCTTDANANTNNCHFERTDLHETNSPACSAACTPPPPPTEVCIEQICYAPEPTCENPTTVGQNNCYQTCTKQLSYSCPTPTIPTTPPPTTTPTPTPVCPDKPILNQTGNTVCDAQTIELTWQATPNAQWYDVRVDDGINDVKDSRNTCAPHAVCINQYKETKITVTVIPGRSYNWWVHASAPVCPQSTATVSQFLVPVCPTGTPPPSSTPTPTPFCPLPQKALNVRVECPYCNTSSVPSTQQLCAASDGCQYDNALKKTGVYCTAWDGKSAGDTGYNTACKNPNNYTYKECHVDDKCKP